MQQIRANDGNLPGGLSPKMVKAMSSDPKIMMILQDKKMQEMMTAIMTKGPDAIKKYMADPGNIIYHFILSHSTAGRHNLNIELCIMGL